VDAPFGEARDEPAADAAFRAGARAWLAGNFEARPVGAAASSLVFADAGDTDHVVRGKAWQRRLCDGGWAGLGWPAEHGGRGLSAGRRLIWAQEAAAAGVPPGISLIGEAVVGPTLMVHGTDDQRRRYLAPILRGDDIWCQLFSEPDAGTDLAGVTTTAVGEGDSWLVTGHKTWTSGAHHADWGLLLARTDWDVPKHEGCTCFVVDMRAPGVTVRPVRQMTGGSAFDEVVLDGVRLPDSSRVGPVGGGWAVAVTGLRSERLELGLGVARAAGGVGAMLAQLRPRGVADDPTVRQLAAQLWIDARLLEILGERVAGGLPLVEGGIPGSEGSLTRLAATRVSRRSDELLDAIRGADAMLVDEWTQVQLWIPATRIGGGTDEAHGTAVAERVLGLPRSPRPDDGVPFREVASIRTGDTSGRPGDRNRHQLPDQLGVEG
jgi:acyl-CoA dehydrogenase